MGSLSLWNLISFFRRGFCINLISLYCVQVYILTFNNFELRRLRNSRWKLQLKFLIILNSCRWVFTISEPTSKRDFMFCWVIPLLRDTSRHLRPLSSIPGQHQINRFHNFNFFFRLKVDRICIKFFLIDHRLGLSLSPQRKFRILKLCLSFDERCLQRDFISLPYDVLGNGTMTVLKFNNL